MKKVLLTVLILSLAIAGVSAGTTDVGVGLSLTGNYFHFGFTAGENTSTKPEAKVGINADATIIFDHHNGFYVNLGFDMEEQNTITIGGGYAYTTPIESSKLVVGVGPHFLIKGSDFVIGADAFADFKLSMTKSMFFRIGGGIGLNFVTISDKNTTGYFEMNLIIPRVAIGWDF